MDKKKIIWVVLSVLIACLSIWAVIAQSSTFSPDEFREFIRSGNKLCILGAVICTLGFILFEGLAVISISKALGYKRNALQGTVYGAADVYFSAITPSASGGQPASAYFMIRDGIPATAVTVILLVNLIMYTLALVFMGVICSVFRFDIVLRMTLFSKILIVAGTVVLILIAIAFFLLLRKAEVFYKICTGFLKFLEKMHLLRHGERIRDKLNATMNEYKACSDVIYGKTSMLIKAFILNVIQRLSQFGVAFFVFLSHGQGIKNSVEVLVTQCFVSVGSNCVPVPGSMGIADYIMIDGYRNIVGNELATYMELIVRGMSFYACMIISLIIVIAAFIFGKKREKKC